MTCPCKVNPLFCLDSKWKPFSEQLQHTCTSIHQHLGCSELHKTWFQAYTSLQQGTCVPYCGHIRQVNGFVHAKSRGCWSRSAGSHSPQRLFCTESSMHRILVTKTRWSLTREIVISSLCCTANKEGHFLNALIL